MQASDIDLVREFAASNSDAAFATLVERHINLVYSVALRRLGNSHEAEEVAQVVFIILAKKAGSLRQGTILSGWLYQTAELTAANFLRTKLRRERREQEAFMQFDKESQSNEWPQVSAFLEDAMSRLKQKERDAIVLRFFENRTIAEVAVALGTGEAAAQKRVNRATEKLRNFFASRGVRISDNGMLTSIGNHAVLVAPVGLAKTISLVAVAKGAAASASTLTLVKGALKVMAGTKTKTAIVIAVAAFLAIGAGTVAVRWTFFPIIRNVYFLPNYRHFQHLPSGLFTLRPTHFTTPVDGLDYSCETDSPAGEHVTWSMVRNRSFAQLLCRTYNCGTWQLVLPPGTPKENFDYLYTLRDPNGLQHFEAAIKRLGYVSHWENQDTPAFLLRVRTPGSRGLIPDGSPRRQRMQWNPVGQLEFQNLSPASLANEIENQANVPVTDETALSTPYDFVLNCSQSDLVNQNWDAVNAALGQLGLELVPTNLPMRMLVVEKID